jgi:mannose-6-phosphate isomerase-like protein (cupin superfamily)
LDINAYIASGVLEHYVFGLLEKEKAAEVEKTALEFPVIAQEIESIQAVVEQYISLYQKQPPFELKNKILEAINQYEVSLPPELTLNSQLSDYSNWINDRAIQPPENFDNLFAWPIGKRPASQLFVLWIRKEEKEHTHTAYTEMAMVVEGTCIMHINGEDIPYQKGDVVEMKPGTLHGVTVTSKTPMKAILMRKAS